MTIQPLLIKIELLNSIDADFNFLHLYPLKFHKNITILIGENGIGKSTILEALAVKLGCPAEGGSRNFKFETENTHLDYTKHLRLTKSFRTIRDIFFYRAESFYTFLSEMNKLDAVESFSPAIKSYYGGRNLHTLSHGESMKALYSNRFKPESIYILDEPEAALSISNQIDFIEKILTLSKLGTQFIIATHSPILMAMPEATLIQLTANGKYETRFVKTNAYYMMKQIINSDGDYLNHIIND